MVGSGYRTSSGSVDYDAVYRSMINAELERPPRASVSGASLSFFTAGVLANFISGAKNMMMLRTIWDW